jgi:hypothetical protein
MGIVNKPRRVGREIILDDDYSDSRGQFISHAS